MGFENVDYEAPFARLEKPGFKEEVQEKFVEWLEERATEPDASDARSSRLNACAEAARHGDKIKDDLGREVFRSLFRTPGAPMYKRLTQNEIDVLEKDFFE